MLIHLFIGLGLTFIGIVTLCNENKQTQPDVITGKALASLYGVSVDDIIFL